MTSRFRNAPLLLLFAERLPEQKSSMSFRYNTDRQIAEVFANDSWIDIADTNQEVANTRQTEVRRETTDDQ